MTFDPIPLRRRLRSGERRQSRFGGGVAGHEHVAEDIRGGRFGSISISLGSIIEFLGDAQIVANPDFQITQPDGTVLLSYVDSLLRWFLDADILIGTGNKLQWNALTYIEEASDVWTVTVKGVQVLSIDGSGNARLKGDIGVESGGFFVAEDGGTLSILSGAVTATNTYHLIETESAAATDDLDTINGGSDGAFLVLRSVAAGRDPTLKDGTGNLVLAGDFTLGDPSDRIMLLHEGGNWVELSRSTNG